MPGKERQGTSRKLLIVWENCGTGSSRAAEAIAYLRQYYDVRLCISEDEGKVSSGQEKEPSVNVWSSSVNYQEPSVKLRKQGNKVQDFDGKDLNSLGLYNGRTVEDIEVLLSDISTVLIPMVSDSLLKDLTEGNMENLLAAVIMEALCSGIPVYALGSNRDETTCRVKAVSAYQKKRRQLMKDCGINILLKEEDSFSKEPQKSGIITEEDILRYAKENRKTIEIRQGDHITPLAADTAKVLGIDILHINSFSQGG